MTKTLTKHAHSYRNLNMGLGRVQHLGRVPSGSAAFLKHLQNSKNYISLSVIYVCTIPECIFRRRQLLNTDGEQAIQLVSYNKTKFVVHSEANSMLRSIGQNKSIAVLSICGPLRTGKSYFMSQILKSDVFKTSKKHDPCTRGIWMSTSIIESDGLAIILLDTEGMDAPQEDENMDVIKYVVITTLLSSYLIYNTTGNPTGGNLETLRYNLVKLIFVTNYAHVYVCIAHVGTLN